MVNPIAMTEEERVLLFRLIDQWAENRSLQRRRTVEEVLTAAGLTPDEISHRPRSTPYDEDEVPLGDLELLCSSDVDLLAQTGKL